MTLTCPCCRAANATAVCRRCRADLGLLAAVEERREFLLAESRRRMAADELREAAELLDEARGLRAGDDLRQLEGILYLLAGQYEEALKNCP